MKCDEYQVLCDCVERGVVAGWHRAHKHQDQPSVEAIHACIENAVMLAISNYFQFEEDRDAEPGNTLDHFPGAKKMVTPSELGLGRTIETWQERCRQHPDHQQGMVTNQMLRDRMQEEIDDLRSALEAVTNPHGKGAGNLPPCFDLRAHVGSIGADQC